MIENVIRNQPTWRLIDHSQFTPVSDALSSFAVDDTLCETVGNRESPAVARPWVHDKTIVLGIQDGRLPSLRAGVSFLEENDWNVIVRNSGGLAVVLDKGIYNLSLILHEKDNSLSIEKGFEVMVTLLRTLLAPYGIEFKTGEIVGSYCPGSYDLSVDGKKFAGISQRRIRGGVSVQVYLCTSGSGSERAKVIKEFYELAGDGVPEQCPPIYPETMASLSEIARQDVIHANLTKHLSAILSHQAEVIRTDLSPIEVGAFERYYARVRERTTKVFSSMKSGT